MDGKSVWIARQVRWLRSRHSPLATRWDRIEVLAAAFAILLSLAMLPAALAVGGQVYTGAARQAAAEQASRTETTAVVLADTTETTSVRMTGSDVPVRAAWRLPDGSERTGDIYVTAGTDAGTRTDIWIDRAGDPVPAPLTRAGALGAACGVTVLAWAGMLGVLALAFWGTRRMLDRRRGNDIAGEWRQLSRDLKRF
ncbi:hypothetical protein [Amycolatopsis sp. GM8]|uniref:Rv1733c family protein n=1 Tax=Amycolatopsis sp. GM8 TaxID=2896530 RepID=UPI001F33C072|nr:hypothetical protein [Amycolatopsis sp. GM8]